MKSSSNHYMNPYLAGVLLGTLLVISYGVLGTGIGASGGLARIAAFLEVSVAKQHVLNGEYFGTWGASPLSYYLVFMLAGTLMGGGISAAVSKRFKRVVEKGNAATTRRRLIFALAGGLLIGFASRLARGCTSGQALSGGAQLLTGSFIFVVALFISGYASAHLFKEQWDD